jgi:hypothetical protein
MFTSIGFTGAILLILSDLNMIFSNYSIHLIKDQRLTSSIWCTKNNNSKNSLTMLSGAARWERVPPLMFWKIWSQLSPILGENHPQIFSDFQKKYTSKRFF